MNRPMGKLLAGVIAGVSFVFFGSVAYASVTQGFQGGTGLGPSVTSTCQGQFLQFTSTTPFITYGCGTIASGSALYVPYTGAVNDVNLNGKNLTNVNGIAIGTSTVAGAGQINVYSAGNAGLNFYSGSSANYTTDCIGNGQTTRWCLQINNDSTNALHLVDPQNGGDVITAQVNGTTTIGNSGTGSSIVIGAAGKNVYLPGITSTAIGVDANGKIVAATTTSGTSGTIVASTGLSATVVTSTTNTTTTLTLNINGGTLQSCATGQNVSSLTATGTIACNISVKTIGGISTSTISFSGTANQIVVATTTNSITLSLPQSIASSSSPWFSAITLGTSTLPAGYLFNAVGANGTSTGGTQIAVMNTASTSYSQFTATADTGTTSTNYMGFGIDNSGSGGIFGAENPYDGYMEGTNGIDIEPCVLGSTSTQCMFRVFIGGMGGSMMKLTIASSSASTTIPWTFGSTITTNGISNTGNITSTTETIGTSTIQNLILPSVSTSTGNYLYLGTGGAVVATGTSAGSTAVSSTYLAVGTGSGVAGYNDATYSSTTKQMALTNASSSLLIGTNFSTSSVTQVFSYTGTVASFTVPTGVTSIVINVLGAGQIASGGYNAFGGSATGTLSVTPGTVLYYVVGQAATSTTGGFPNGGAGQSSGGYGGSGMSWVSTSSQTFSTTTVTMVGAGAGGGSSGSCAGGNGGGLTGSTGGGGGGTGGSQTAGGSTGGSAGTGGSASSGSFNGGGGSGYYGGGAGSGSLTCGGGGSSYINSSLTGTSTAASSNTGNGSITLTYAPQITMLYSSSLAIGGPIIFSGSSTVITPSIGGTALLAGGCSTATSSIDTTVASSTSAFITTPQIYPGDGAWWSSYLSATGVLTTKVCAVMALTPTASKYVVKIIK